MTYCVDGTAGVPGGSSTQHFCGQNIRPTWRESAQLEPTRRGIDRTNVEVAHFTCRGAGVWRKHWHRSRLHSCPYLETTATVPGCKFGRVPTQQAAQAPSGWWGNLAWGKGDTEITGT